MKGYGQNRYLRTVISRIERDDPEVRRESELERPASSTRILFCVCLDSSTHLSPRRRSHLFTTEFQLRNVVLNGFNIVDAKLAALTMA